VSGRDDLVGEVQPLPEIVNTLRGQSVVIPLPRELGLDETPGGQALHGLDDLEVRDIKFFMLWRIVILLSNKDTLLEEVLVDAAPVFFGNDHAGLNEMRELKEGCELNGAVFL